MSEHFFVHVVESPSSSDLLNNMVEGFVLYQALCTSRIDAGFLLAVNENSFWEAIGERLLSRIAADKFQRWPVLHLSAHGDRNGIALTNGQRLTWDTLGKYFRDLNQLLGGRLIVAMSSCEGAWAIKAAFKSPVPFFAVVGPTCKIDLSDLAIGFSAFYHILSKKWNLQTSLDAMKVASGNENFYLKEGEKAKRDYDAWKLQKEIRKILGEMQVQGLPEPPLSPESA